MYKYESISAPIFKLWFDHGINPDGQSYAYCLVPMATRQKMENLEKKPSFQILTNESNLQTVASQDLKWIGIVFYQAGKSTLLGGVEVDQPCVLLIRKEARGLTVSLSDPTQKLKSIRLKINGVYKSSDGSAVAQKDGKSEIIIALPSGNEAGKTVTKKLKG
jgi:chondroitin AC lyase